MDWLQIIISAGVGGVILFLWNGLTNNLPWGIGSVASLEEAPDLGETVKAQLNEGRDAMLLSDVVVAFVVARPLSYYSLPRYFAVEFLTQLGVGFLLSVIIGLTMPLETNSQILLIALVASVASCGTFFQFWNWWGFPMRLALGSAVNLMIGWVTVAVVSVNFIL